MDFILTQGAPNTLYLFSSKEGEMKEKWKEIPDFPNYSVSNLGNVLNDGTGKIVWPSLTQQGAVKVNLNDGNRQRTRSVKVLVAEAFVAGKEELMDTPIHLDGDQQNNVAINLAWRPRWFAWQYTRQFVVMSDVHNRGPIFDVKTKQRYSTIFEAAVIHGLLIKDIWRSIHFKKAIFPTYQTFDFVR